MEFTIPEDEVQLYLETIKNQGDIKMSNLQKIKELENQIKALKSEIPTQKINGLTVKIGEKGTINIYGLGRFPVCLYFSQVQKITDLLNQESFANFIIDNKDKLAFKE